MKLIRSLATAAALLLALSTQRANATPAVLDYSGNGGPGLSLEITSGGVFQTTGAAALSSLLNWVSFLPAVNGVGSVQITDVDLVGNVQTLAPGLYEQDTTGGEIQVFDSINNLLLSVNFTTGELILSSTGTGGQFTVGTSTFGGPLASFLVPDSATHSISLINWSPVSLISGIGGSPIVDGTSNTLDIGETSTFAPSSGFGNGLIAGDPVPEPATMLLLGSGLLGLASRRRAKA